MSTSNSAPRLRCEALEPRDTPDGNVGVAVDSGIIFLSGDALNNGVAVQQDQFGNVFVNGFNSTTVNGVSSIFLGNGVPVGLIADLGGGSDNTQVGGLVVSGNIEIMANSGNDATVVLGSRAGGAIVVNGTDGDDVTWMSGVAATFIVAEGGTGFDRTHIDNASAFGLIANLGDGGDNTEIFGVSVTANVEILAGAGNDATTLLGVRAGGSVVVNGTSGDDMTWLSGVASNVVVLEGDTGFDRVHADNVFAPGGFFIFDSEQPF